MTMSSTSGMSIMEEVYAVCTATPPHAEELYRCLRGFLESHSDETLRRLSSAGEFAALREYDSEWAKFSVGAECLHNAFRYLNQHWIKRIVEESKQKLVGMYLPGGGAGASSVGMGSSSHASVMTALGGAVGVHEINALCLLMWRDRVFVRCMPGLAVRVGKAMEADRNGDLDGAQLLKHAGVVLASAVRLSSIFDHHSAPAHQSPGGKPAAQTAAPPLSSGYLDLYNKYLEPLLLRETSEYYAREMADFVASNGVTAFLVKAEQRIEEEHARIRRVVLASLGSATSAEKMKRALYAAVVERQKQLILSESEQYLSSGRVVDLNRAFKLLRFVDGGLPSLAGLVERWMVREWSNSIASPSEEDPRRFVESLIDVHKRGVELVKGAFADDRLFLLALDRSCKKVFNQDGNSQKTPEFLARYCDILFRRGGAGGSSGQSRTGGIGEDRSTDDERIAEIVCVFRYTEEKDVFQRFYTRLLAKRLIMGTSVSEYLESSMITGLKPVCGFEYANKLTRMFTDVTLSTEMNEQFADVARRAHPEREFDFTVHVLTTGYWPLQSLVSMSSFRPPADVVSAMQQFGDFYTSKHQGRKLQWLNHLSKAELRCHAMTGGGPPTRKQRPYEFQVTGLQASVLLLLNSRDALTSSSVQEETGLNVQEVDGILAALREGRLIAQSQPSSSAPDAEATFALNTVFHSKRIKVKIPAIAAGMSVAGATRSSGDTAGGGLRGAVAADERNATYKSLDEDRKLYLQAAIVRIMKSRKELSHVQLVQEVISQASGRFVPSVASIKKCVESLIEKEFLRRLDSQSDRYVYIA